MSFQSLESLQRDGVRCRVHELVNALAYCVATRLGARCRAAHAIALCAITVKQVAGKFNAPRVAEVCGPAAKKT